MRIAFHLITVQNEPIDSSDRGLFWPITIVLPAYNEAEALDEVLESISGALASRGWPYRVIVVDDGSDDGTAEIAERASSRLPVRLVRHDVNRGLGGALQTGLLQALRAGGVIVTMDADNSHDPEVIADLMKRLADGYDVVVASRFRKGAVRSGIPPHRQLLSAGASLFLRLSCPVRNVRDYSSGYRAYRASAIRRVVETHGERRFIREPGFACMVELLLDLTAAGATVSEVPIVLRYDQKRSASKMRVLSTVRRYGAVVRRQRRQRARGPAMSAPSAVLR